MDIKPQLAVKFSLAPEASRKLAEEKTKNLSDEEVAKRAKELVEYIEPQYAILQELYRDGARATHEKSPEKQLFADYGDFVLGDLQSVLDSLSLSPDEPIIPSERTFLHLPSLLSASTLILYTSWEFSKTRTNREIVMYGEAIREKIEAHRTDESNVKMDIDTMNSLDTLTRDDVFCLRDATPEYDMQTKLFDTLKRLLNEIAGRLKSIGAHDAAMEPLKLILVLEKRPSDFRECLKEPVAKDFTNRFKELFTALRLEIMYSKLGKAPVEEAE